MGQKVDKEHGMGINKSLGSRDESGTPKKFITLTPELKSEKFGDPRESLCGKKSLPTVSSEAATKSLKRDLATFHRNHKLATFSTITREFC